jgi:hypothetical protein
LATTDHGVEIREMTEQQWFVLFDQAARRYLGISGEEFIRRWDAGEFASDERWEVAHVSMLLPNTQ